MPKPHLLFFLLTILILAASELAVVLFTVSPVHATSTVYWTFFGSLFFSLASLLSLTWYGVKRSLIYRSNSVPMWPAIRQASLLALLVSLSLFLYSLHIASLWDLVPLAIAALLIEFFFQADKTSSLTSSDA